MLSPCFLWRQEDSDFLIHMIPIWYIVHGIENRADWYMIYTTLVSLPLCALLHSEAVDKRPTAKGQEDAWQLICKAVVPLEDLSV